MHKRTYRYRIYPTKAQRAALQRSLDACRWVYNQALAIRKDAWE
ncbi:MAG: transposase, partial [Anaerolineales bacterium]